LYCVKLEDNEVEDIIENALKMGLEQRLNDAASYHSSLVELFDLIHDLYLQQRPTHQILSIILINGTFIQLNWQQVL
jgi:hypothetical protein